ncbi:fungal and bacterial [Gymnopilus junonius]|uniref:Fungal and bacterial n=1 Tax=Gymnopilus junonius TaxID=109634 RepID=A0A9P5NWK6_GYMJU|nr:fungal and bacterial [Gymnopilus junonius]
MRLPVNVVTNLAVIALVMISDSQHNALTTQHIHSPHEPFSSGPIALPFMRPEPGCRTFNSTAVENVISDMKSLLKDPDLARLFENTFPNTLDTTVKYYSKSENLAFIITGVYAQWLRDTATRFLAVYVPLLHSDPELASLVKAVINNEARYVTQYPYPPPESGIPPAFNGNEVGARVFPPYNASIVYDCKYEIDSLCAFLKLSRSYYNATKDASFINEAFQASFDENYNFISYYRYTGSGDSGVPFVNNNGTGEPKAYTGMVGTHHRPSDDLSVFAFLTPANAMLSVELTHLAQMLDEVSTMRNVSQQAKEWSTRITNAIWENTVVNNVFAYETNGFGSRYVMDDANVPSLLSLPYLGFLDRSHPTYVATRALLLSHANPYYAVGPTWKGIGGPHIDAWNPWHMAQISSIYGTDNGQDILDSLNLLLNNTSGLGLMHESLSIYNSSSYTRSWFAWANSYFAEMVLDLADRKPELILKENKSYRPGQ